jgi:Lrp/AsnC family transcriptional regulator, leucine-responsive regulatory protein
MPKREFDEIDRHILELLQDDARLTNIELADKVGLTPSPCLRRLKQLEQGNVINRYRAILNRVEVGLGLTVFVNIKVERHHDTEANAFREAVRSLPEVVSCHLISGDSDFLLQVVLPDLAGYETFLVGTLLKLPSVKDIRSNFAIQTIKAHAPLPLDHFGEAK